VKLLKPMESGRARNWIGVMAVMLAGVLLLFPSVFREATQSAFPTAAQAEPWKVSLISWLGMGGCALLMISPRPGEEGGRFRMGLLKVLRTTIFVACVVGLVVGTIVFLMWWLPRLAA
jgi:hypothetical protein